MADVAVQNPTTGEFRMVAEEDAPSFTQQTGWVLPDQTQRERGAKILESGGVGDQALATGEAALRTGTFGLVPGVSKGWKQRAEVLHEEHPYVEMGARAAGALAPALATGGLAGGAVGAAEAAGVGARTAGLVAGGLEGLAGGAADEIEQAREETRDVSVGNIFLYGLGGEIAGRALPAALKMGAGRVRRALTAAEEVAGEGVPSALAGVEARSVESEAKLARDLPQGPERTALLDRTAPQQYEHLAEDGATTLEQFSEQAQSLSTPNKRVTDRLRRALPDDSPAQQNWFTEQKRALGDEYLSVDRPRRAPEPAPAPAVAPTVAPASAAPDAASEYALDAARRRLRGVADHTGRADLDTLAGEIGERSEAAKSLPDDVKKAINERTGKAKLDEVISWAKDPEALRAGHGFEPAPPTTPPVPPSGPRPVAAPAPATPAAPLDLGPYGKDVRNIVRPGLRRMDAATGIADQYFATRDMAAQLEAVGARVQKDASLAPSVRDEIAASIGERAKALRSGLTDESLFGDAAKLESDLARGAQKMNAGLSEIETLTDPSKMRKFLQSDRVDRMKLGRKLDDALDGAEDLLSTHEAHGTLDTKQIAEQRARIQRLREARGLADEIQVAKSARAEPVTAQPKPKSTGLAADLAVEVASHVLPYGHTIGTVWRLAKRIKGIDEAARAATKQTARRLAGTAAGDVERSGLGQVIGKAVREEAVAAADRVVPGASKAYTRAREIIEQRRSASGMADVGAAAESVHPKIDQLTGKLEARVGKLREIEGAAPTGSADELGIHPTAERHAARLEQARGQVDESLHALRDEYHGRIDDLTQGRAPEELGPKARAKYDRFKSGLDDLEQTLSAHGAATEHVQGVDLYTLGDRAPEAAEAYLGKVRAVGGQRGSVDTGAGIRGILTSPMALTAGGGAALLAAPKAISALERFQGDYSGPEESFAAKRKLLDQDLVAPDALFEALGASMEDLPKLSPQLFQQLSARMADKMRMVRANLPAGIKTTMMYPNGTPPSMSAMREFAMLWNTTMHPHSVLEDIHAGTATGQQMKILKQSDPDLYEQLHSDVVSEIGQNFRNIPLSTKLQMDILFDADGVAGPFFSSKAAGYIAQANKEQAARGPQQSAAPSLDKMTSTSGPAGLGAIQSSVTNKGMAA